MAGVLCKSVMFGKLGMENSFAKGAPMITPTDLSLHM